MDKKKKIIAAVIAAVVIIAVAVAVSISMGGTNESQVTATEDVKVMPTFMYFVSASDENHAQAMTVIEELKKEYGSKVKFDIKDIDAEPELKDRFPVGGQTPALIMLNTSNDISRFEFKCADKEKLKGAIEAALK